MTVKRATLVIALATALVAAPVATTALTRSAATTVTVTGKEFRFILSRKSGPHGTFIFKFNNAGKLAHDFKIAGKKTPQVQPGKSFMLTVKIAKPGRYPYLCTVPGHAAAGMKGVFVVK
jgi:uncharacterized cupredoxin-like copper-binding protein